MQTEKSQREGKGIIVETRFTEFLALSIDPRDWISRSAGRDQCLIIFLTYDINNHDKSFVISFIFDILSRIRTDD